MLNITIAEGEAFDEEKQRFVSSPETKLSLEHSLFSISKWEQKWELPFLATEDKTQEQSMSYIQMMNTAPEVSPETLVFLNSQQLKQISDYMNAKMTATWFREVPTQTNRNGEIITAELVYYWMTALNIPFECQHWHFNTLLTLIKVCNEKNKPPNKRNKMGKADMLAQRRALNEQRLAQSGSRG